MRHGYLSDYFVGVGIKKLSAVDVDHKRSNQHEIGTTLVLRQRVLGESQRQKFEVQYISFKNDDTPAEEIGWASHYDSRLNNPMRSPEWRLYYPSNSVTSAMSAGDTLVLAKDRNERIWFIIVSPNSDTESQLLWLFGMEIPRLSFGARKISGTKSEVRFPAAIILEKLGITLRDENTGRLDEIIEKFGTVFPSTAIFSELSRKTLFEPVSIWDDPDGALIAWLEHEEALFRRLEHRVVSDTLKKGFSTSEGVDVENFIRFSLSVQNRRKSRMGRSLENHISVILTARGLLFERGVTTELGHRPDFLFPGSEYYLSARKGDSRLFMLGAKSSCKDRWRQVLVEAEKIPMKHLLTLEPGISDPQLNQMKAAQLQLVVPTPIHGSYRPAQRARLWSLKSFIEEVALRSSEAGTICATALH